MDFSLDKCNQSRIQELELKLKLYEKLNEAAKNKTWWIRLSGPGAGLAVGSLTILRRLALIIENFVKGIFNIFGALVNHRNCKFTTGLKQLIVEIPRHIILLPFSTARGVLEVFDMMLGMLVFPERRTKELYKNADETLDDLIPGRQIMKGIKADLAYN